MMTITNIRTLVVASFFFSTSVLAVCDECAKAALDTATSSMQSSIQATTTVVSSNGAAINALSTLNSTNSSALQLQLSTLSQQELTAFDGMATKISSQLKVNAKQSEINFNNLIINMQRLSDNEVANDQINYTDRTFGPLSKPLSGKLNVPRIDYIVSGYEVKEVVQQTFIESMQDWLDNPADEDGNNIEQLALLEDEELFDISEFIQNKVISAEELDKLKTLIQLIVEPNPQPNMSIEKAQESKANRMLMIAQKQKRIKQQVVHSVITEAVMDKAPFIVVDDSWSSSYLSFDENFSGMVSFNQFYESETLGKVTSADWYDDISQLTEAGLLREQIHQANTTNMLLSEILKAERKEALLVALETLSGG